MDVLDDLRVLRGCLKHRDAPLCRRPRPPRVFAASDPDKIDLLWHGCCLYLKASFSCIRQQRNESFQTIVSSVGLSIQGTPQNIIGRPEAAGVPRICSTLCLCLVFLRAWRRHCTVICSALVGWHQAANPFDSSEINNELECSNHYRMILYVVSEREQVSDKL